MAHLLCTDQPKGAIASWAQVSSHEAGQECQVVGYTLALSRVEQQAFDGVVVDFDEPSDASLSLLAALWKRQPTVPVWLATRAGRRAERLLGGCAPAGPVRRVRSAGTAVSLQAMTSLSATALIALRQWVRK